MIRAAITTELDNHQFAPGSQLRGAVNWQVDSELTKVELRLFYYTTGKGTRDAEVVDTHTWDSPPSVLDAPFSFDLPEGPYSFSGQLISLIWALELVLEPGHHTERLEVTVSPTGHEINLQRYPVAPELDDPNWKEKRWGARDRTRMIAARNNPFATERIEELLPYDPGWIGDSWDAILERLENQAWRGAVIGPHGSGKTTFLETVAGVLLARGVPVASLFINRQSPSSTVPSFLEDLDRECVILFDGAEQLSWLAWRRFLRETGRARGLIVTGHRPGRLPTLLETLVTPEILLRCVETLDQRGPFDQGDASRLFQKHAGNLRHALLSRYDDMSADKTPSH